jgi:DNA-binding NtrC family response regulator
MQGSVTAVLIFQELILLSDLQAALHKLAVHTQQANTLADARRVLSKVNPPLLAFTGSALPDGNWADVVSFSQGVSSRVSVIVVGQEVDTKLYASAIEVGAFDFIAPPFDAYDLAHVVRCAADNALARRKAAPNAQATTRKVLPIAVRRGKVPEQGIW